MRLSSSLIRLHAIHHTMLGGRDSSLQVPVRCITDCSKRMPAGHDRVCGPGSPAARAPRGAAGEVPLRHQRPGTLDMSLHLSQTGMLL